MDTSDNSKLVNTDLLTQNIKNKSTTNLSNKSITDISVLEILSNPWEETVNKNDEGVKEIVKKYLQVELYYKVLRNTLQGAPDS
ncbi:4789_t:CDS:2, partial [Gigaspora margarita]